MLEILNRKKPNRRRRVDAGIIEERREVVSRLLVRKLSEREIAVALPKQDPPILKLDGSPWTRAVIHLDIGVIRAQWLENMSANMHTVASSIHEELERLIARGWAMSDEGKGADIVLKAIESQKKLFGIDAPEKRMDVTENYTIKLPDNFPIAPSLGGATDQDALATTNITCNNERSAPAPPITSLPAEGDNAPD